MRKIAILILAILGLTAKAQVSDPLIQDTIDMYIYTNNAKAITAAQLNKILTLLNENKWNKDSLNCYWDETFGNITNTNHDYFVIIDSLMKIYPLPPESQPRAIGRIIGIETDGQIKWNTPYDLFTSMLDTIMNNPSVGTSWLRDTTNGEIYEAHLTDQVGIGTADPTEMLDVNGNINLPTTTASVGQIKINGTPFIHNWDGQIHIGTGGNLTSSGNNNIIIGSESTGVTNATGFSNVLVGDSVMVRNSTGYENTFIGHHAGKNVYRNSSTFGSRNTAIGAFALECAYNGTSTAAGNVVIGYYAARGLTTKTSTIQGNVIIGNSAATSKVSGTNNVYIGNSAAITDSTGLGNVAVGGSAGYKIKTSQFNTMVGFYSGFNATGGSNVFIGYMAGYSETGSNLLYIDNSNTSTPLIKGDFSADTLRVFGKLKATNFDMPTTTSSQGIFNQDGSPIFHTYQDGGGANMFFGAGAGNYTTTGNYNTMFGYRSGVLLTSGAYNTALGYDAGAVNTTGAGNITIGYSTAELMDGGDDNISIGMNTLDHLVSGDANVAIGNDAGHLVTGSNNIFLGNRAGYNETGSGKLYIENSSVDSTEALIFGNFTTDVVRMNGDLRIGGSGNDYNVYIGYNTSAGGDTGDSLYFPNLTSETGAYICNYGGNGSTIELGDDVKIKDDMTFGGDITYGDTFWDDLTFPASQIKLGATAKPDYDFDECALLFPYSDSTELIVANIQLPHRWSAGTSIYPHVHWIEPGTAAGDTCEFILKYRWTDMGEGPSATFTRIETTYCTYFMCGAGKCHQLALFPAISGSGHTESSILDIKLFRKEDVGKNGDIEVKAVDFHFEIDKPGSYDQMP